MKMFAAAAVLICILFFVLRAPDDAAVIEKMLTRGASLGSFDVNESPIERLAAAVKISEMFAEEAQIVIVTSEGEEEYKVSKQDVKERILAVRNSLAQLAVSTTGVKVEVDGDAATATFTGGAMGRDPEREDYFLEKHLLELKFIRTEDAWKISAGRNLDIIEK